jgi:hypothetical protein
MEKNMSRAFLKCSLFLPFCLSNSRTSLIFRGKRGRQRGNEDSENEKKSWYGKEGKKRNGNEERRKEKVKGMGKSVRNENEKVIEKRKEKSMRGEKELGWCGWMRRRRRL